MEEHATIIMPLEEKSDCSAEIQLMKERLSGLETEEGRRNGLGFVPESSDVFVVTTPKAGELFLVLLQAKAIKFCRNNMDATDLPSTPHRRLHGF